MPASDNLHDDFCFFHIKNRIVKVSGVKCFAHDRTRILWTERVLWNQTPAFKSGSAIDFLDA